MRWLECLLCHLSFYGTWLSSYHIQPYSFLVAHSQSRLKGGSGQFAEFLHPHTVTTLALFCAKIAVNSLVVIGREVSTSLWQKMRHSTNGLGWFWQTEALLCPSKLPGLPQLVLVTPDSSGLSSVAGDDCWHPWQVAMWAVGHSYLLFTYLCWSTASSWREWQEILLLFFSSFSEIAISVWFSMLCPRVKLDRNATLEALRSPIVQRFWMKSTDCSLAACNPLVSWQCCLPIQAPAVLTYATEGFLSTCGLTHGPAVPWLSAYECTSGAVWKPAADPRDVFQLTPATHNVNFVSWACGF